MKEKFYITTAIAYGNASPHIGHALEFVMGDTYARHYKLLGKETYFVTGMDEHGQKIEAKAKEIGIAPQELVDRTSKEFQELDNTLGVDYDFFVRTSDKEKHYKGAQELWRRLVEKGDIEKRKYEGIYCVGCEAFKKESDLNEKGECPIHLIKPEIIEEENYFFKLSKYSSQIREKIATDELKIYPESRKNEILAFIDRGLEDVSFSRPKEKVSWGIPVPEDDSHVMYVWCDALSNYITAIGYGSDSFRTDLWNSATHLIGKDILRFHAAIWPGMLLSAGLPLPKSILVHGFITSGGQKMSKTIGNVIDPKEIIEMLRPACGDLAGEALRFVLLHEVPTFDDGDLTIESIKSAYNSYLANGLGNLTSRVMKLSSEYLSGDKETELKPLELSDFNIKKSLETITREITALDEVIQKDEAFKVIKIDSGKGEELIRKHRELLKNIVFKLSPFIPQTSQIILECIKNNKMPEKPLFGRLN